MTRAVASTTPPEGFLYRPDFVASDEEEALAAEVAGMDFSEVRFRDVVARRRVVHFGWVYDLNSHEMQPGPQLPPLLGDLRGRAATLLEIEPERLEEALVTEYQPGATIGWHRDAPAFGSRVVGISLGSACRMRFRRRREEAWETYAAILEPRSAYVIGGAARAVWQHSIPAGKELRYSITFRTLRRPRGGKASAPTT